jgi:peptidoglycan hydrolase-like protein with peptidoglycan-binding domain
MSTNRVSWILVAVVVVVVGFLVFRTVQHDSSTRTEPVPGSTQVNPQANAKGTLPPLPRNPDSLRAAAAKRVREPGSVEQAKAVLKERGFYNGPMNGSYDPVLADALKRFQKSVGMKPTGYLDEKTYAALGIQLHRKRP